jgi:hypothetical protein
MLHLPRSLVVQLDSKDDDSYLRLIMTHHGIPKQKIRI